MTTTPFHNPNRRTSNNNDNHEFPIKKIGANTKDSREFAKRMIMDGIMPLETVARLSGLSMAVVRELTVEIEAGLNGDA